MFNTEHHVKKISLLITNYRHIITFTARKIAVQSHFTDGKTAARFHNTDIKCLLQHKIQSSNLIYGLKVISHKIFLCHIILRT